MGRNTKYSEDVLLEAVVRYADICKTKIVATSLAEWARMNIPGMEDIRYYHFLRPIKYKDSKSGEVKERQRLCTERIAEINNARSLIKSDDINILLQSSDPFQLIELPISVQKQVIKDAREKYQVLTKYLLKLQKEKSILDANYRMLEMENEKLIQQFEFLLKENSKLMSKINKAETSLNGICKQLEENKAKNKLSEIGITDRGINLEVMRNNLTLSKESAFGINEAISNVLSDELSDKDETKDINHLIQNFINDITVVGYDEEKNE